jgi:hypothetical protein
MGLLVVRLADMPLDAMPPALAAHYASAPDARLQAAVEFIRENATHVEVLHAH